MESAFLWGAVFGMGIRASACRIARLPLCYKLYQYPSYMLFFGLSASFFDWQRRRHLEDLCANEDRLEAEVNQIRLNFLPIGAENHSETKKEVMHALVDEHIY